MARKMSALQLKYFGGKKGRKAVRGAKRSRVLSRGHKRTIKVENKYPDVQGGKEMETD